MNRRHFLKVSVAGAAAAMAWRSSAAVFAQGSKDIVDTAVAAGSFKTLAAALGAAGLVETLKGAGPFTVFAPTDEAFAKLPAGTVEMLLKPENKDKLVAILTYHVLPRQLESKQMLAGPFHVRTLKASPDRTLAITKNASGVTVDSAPPAIMTGERPRRIQSAASPMA